MSNILSPNLGNKGASAINDIIFSKIDLRYPQYLKSNGDIKYDDIKIANLAEMFKLAEKKGIQLIIVTKLKISLAELNSAVNKSLSEGGILFTSNKVYMHEYQLVSQKVNLYTNDGLANLHEFKYEEIGKYRILFIWNAKTKQWELNDSVNQKKIIIGIDMNHIILLSPLVDIYYYANNLIDIKVYFIGSNITNSDPNSVETNIIYSKNCTLIVKFDKVQVTIDGDQSTISARKLIGPQLIYNGHKLWLSGINSVNSNSDGALILKKHHYNNCTTLVNVETAISYMYMSICKFHTNLILNGKHVDCIIQHAANIKIFGMSIMNNNSMALHCNGSNKITINIVKSLPTLYIFKYINEGNKIELKFRGSIESLDIQQGNIGIWVTIISNCTAIVENVSMSKILDINFGKNMLKFRIDV